MLKHIAQQVSGRITALSTRLCTLVKEQVWPSASRLLVSFTQAFLSAVNLKSLLVQTMSNIKALLANLTTQAQLTKAALINVKAKATLLGQQLLSTVRQTSQHAVLVLLQIKDKLVASIKSALLHFKGIGFVQTRMELQSTQAGEKPKGRVKQRRRRAKQASKKDN